MATGTDDTESTSGRRTEHDYQVDRRLIVLETRFDTILPLLATKADIADLRAEVKAGLSEIRAEISRLSVWMATMFITTILGFGTIAAALPRH